jgi:hypothetical protein
MINLLSPEERKEIRSEYRRRVLSVCLPMSAGVLFVAILSVLPSCFLAMVANEKILKESLSAEVVSKKTQEAEMNLKVRDANGKIALLKRPMSGTDPRDIFGQILKARAPEIVFTGFTYEKRSAPTNAKNKAPVTSVVLQGLSENRDAIQSFAGDLKKNKNFISVDLPISSLVSEADFPYSINIMIKE